MRCAPVYKNLNYKWSWRGLQMFHFGIAGGLAFVVQFVCVLVGANLMYAVAFFGAAVAALALLQWRKSDTYIPDLINLALLPRHLTCLDDDPLTHPFPVSRCELSKSR